MIKIAPSILNADFANLEKEIRDVEKAGVDYLHVDVMDGNFVPNISFGPPVVEAIWKVTSLPLDVHLMITNPDFYIPAFAAAGADIISVHVEACPHLHRTVQLIKHHGKKAGIVLNPATPLHTIQHIIEDIDLLLLMTVNPGFGAQSFIASMLPKIREARTMIEATGLPIELEVDGGVNKETAKLCVDAGANVLVVGSAIYLAEDRQAAYTENVETLK